MRVIENVRKVFLLALLMLAASCDLKIDGLLGKDDDGAAARALFFTAGFVHTDSGIVNHVASKIAQSPHYNSVLAVLDLQTGRSYIFNGRSDVGIHPQALAHINTYKKHGVRPIVIIRNDWAARTRSGTVPSIGGRASASNFYTHERMLQEVIFISNFTDAVKGVDIMYAFEASAPQSVAFYLELIQKAKSVAGFKGRIYVNFLGEARALADSRWGEFASMGVKSATSQNTLNWNLGEDVINTDGNTGITAHGAAAVLEKLKATGKPYFFWTRDTAKHSVPDALF